MKNLFEAIEKLTPIEFEKRNIFLNQIEFIVFMHAFKMNSMNCLHEIKFICENYLGEPRNDQWKEDVYGLIRVWERAESTNDIVKGFKQ